MATVVLVGTLDTKGQEYAYLRQRVRAEGCDVLLVDAGVKGAPLTQPDISREEVARAAGADLAELVARGDRGVAIETMARGATVVLTELFAQGRLHGVLGLGGSGGSALVTPGHARLAHRSPQADGLNARLGRHPSLCRGR